MSRAEHTPLIAPPRFVRRNSTSELRGRISFFSANAGAVSGTKTTDSGDGGNGLRHGSRCRYWSMATVKPAPAMVDAPDAASRKPATRPGPYDAKCDGNPCLSIHRYFGRGYSQTDAVVPRCPRRTGSRPCPPHGWQRARRFNPIHVPRTTPNVSTASKNIASKWE